MSISQLYYEDSLNGMNDEIVICQKFWPNIPVIMWKRVAIYYASVTPNCPIFVCKTPVWYYIQFEVQNIAKLAVNIIKTSSISNLAAWQIPRMKKVIENESHPWSKSCPSGELDLVLLACLPSIESKVE